MCNKSKLTLAGQEWDKPLGLYKSGVRLYDPWAGVWLTREPLPGRAWEPRTWHRYVYAYASPISYYDPYGLQACTDSTDPECQLKATLLKNEALRLKEEVRLGKKEPVEAFARLLEYADTLFNQNPQGIMWGTTNVLLGVDPNKVEVWRLGLAGKYNIEQHQNPYYVGQDWLPYKHDPSQGARHSERGDWAYIYWDATPNQAYHFWYFAAVEFYHGPIQGTFLGLGANIVHDPFWLEPVFGQDLGELRKYHLPYLSAWPDYTSETSFEDFMLALKGMEFGAIMWMMKITRLPHGATVCGAELRFFPEPEVWIRQNLKGR